MFRVVNQALPVVAKKLKLQPAFLIWDGIKRGAGPLLKVSIYANWWQNPGWENQILNLDSPISVGEYCRVGLSFTPSQAKISNYQQVTSAIAAVADSFWLDGQFINFYKVSDIPTEITIAFASSEFTAVGSDYVFNLPANFTATQVQSEGLTFSFTQSGSTVTLNGSSSYRLDVGQSVEFVGTLDNLNILSKMSIVSFYLDLIYLDTIAWLGREFSPVKDLANIEEYSFIWDSKTQIAKLFVDSQLLPNYGYSTSNFDLSASGTITYLR